MHDFFCILENTFTVLHGLKLNSNISLKDRNNSDLYRRKHLLFLIYKFNSICVLINRLSFHFMRYHKLSHSMRYHKIQSIISNLVQCSKEWWPHQIKRKSSFWPIQNGNKDYPQHCYLKALGKVQIVEFILPIIPEKPWILFRKHRMAHLRLNFFHYCSSLHSNI